MQVAVGRAYKLRAAAAAARGLDFNYPDRNLGIKGTAAAAERSLARKCTQGASAALGPPFYADVGAAQLNTRAKRGTKMFPV